MKKNIIIVSIVILAIALTLWLKPSSSTNSNSDILGIEKANADNKVLLFANPREANSSCGCAEVISVARSSADIPGVVFQEFDLKYSQDETKKYSVRIFPTVIFLNKENIEIARFEGESVRLIEKLRQTVNSLNK